MRCAKREPLPSCDQAPQALKNGCRLIPQWAPWVQPIVFRPPPACPSIIQTPFERVQKCKSEKNDFFFIHN